METKWVTEFSSERTFDIYDAEVGYHFLLVRSQGGIHDPINVDLIFGGVLYVELSSSLFDIKVTKPCDEKSVELEKAFTTYQSAEYKGEFVYAIDSRNKRFNVVASALWIHVNTLSESSLTPMCGEGKDDYYKNSLKEEYKLL